MSEAIFRPFERYNFDDNICYVTGEASIFQTTVFPEWILTQFNLHDKPFKLLDEQISTYQDITIPVSAKAATAIDSLENEINEAFNLGYDSVKGLSDLKLFQWISKQVYGMIHWEVRAGMRSQKTRGEDFNFSQSIAHKFSNLHIMLQSLILPMEFEGITPWSIQIFPVSNPSNTFNYRDEINTLVFSLRMNDFGIIASLQDNGESLNHHRSILETIKEKPLHPIQFEELCARFFYSAYLFNRLPEYSILPTKETIFIEPMPLRLSSKPVYDNWQVKTYGQVLENFWKSWGLLLFEIVKDPENPISFLLDEKDEFIEPDEINIQLSH